MIRSNATINEIWDKFDELASISKEDRRETFLPDGVKFLKNFMSVMLINSDDPQISDAEEYDKFIVDMRANYRQWKQHLMALMTKFASSSDQQGLTELTEFAQTCHWLALVDAAKNFVDSQSD